MSTFAPGPILPGPGSGSSRSPAPPVSPCRLANLSVLVHPAHRGRGLGTAVAAGAVAGSVATGLLPQWRARTTLLASRQIARSLGFVELGRQTTYELSARLGRGEDS